MFLEMQNISKKIGQDYVLQGENGCGKSMLMRVICGLVLPTEGKVLLDGEQLGREISFPRSAGVLIEKPDLVILDEPANALDEKSAEVLWDIVQEERDRGALVIVSCHTSEVLEKISDEIYRMACGEIKEHIVL